MIDGNDALIDHQAAYPLGCTDIGTTIESYPLGCTDTDEHQIRHDIDMQICKIPKNCRYGFSTGMSDNILLIYSYIL